MCRHCLNPGGCVHCREHLRHGPHRQIHTPAPEQSRLTPAERATFFVSDEVRRERALGLEMARLMANAIIAELHRRDHEDRRKNALRDARTFATPSAQPFIPLGAAAHWEKLKL